MFEPPERESFVEAFIVRTAIAVSFAFTVLGLILVGYYYNIIVVSSESVRTADSDNVTWTVAQTEVDFQNLQQSLLRSLLNMQSGAPADLNMIKRSFDIYYSRSNAVQSVYNVVSGAAEKDPGIILNRLNQQKKEMAEVLDRWADPSSEDIKYFLDLVDQSDDDVRTFTTQMLEILVADAAAARVGQLNVLSRFAILLAVVVALLLSMLAVSLLLLKRLQNKAVATASIADNLRRIIETSQDAVIISDSRGRVLQYNRSAQEIFGYEAEETIGVPMQDLFIPADQRTAHCAGMAKYLDTGKKTIVDSGRHVMTACDKSGREFSVELTVSTSSDKLGDTIFIGILRDVSVRLAKAKELKTALEEAKQDALAKEKFLAVMSHEMRTPLQGVLATFDLLETEIEDLSSKSLIELGRQSGTKALDQINTALELVRLNEGESFNQAEIIDPIQSLQNLVKLLEPLLKKKGNKVELTLNASSDLRIVSNQYMFDALFDNLLSNANKFTEHGQIFVSVHTKVIGDDRIELIISVRDTGIGIETADLEAIFNDFATSDATYTRGFEGTGLGLGLVRRCSEKMGGQITVKSELGVGSEFSFKCEFETKNGHALGAHANLMQERNELDEINHCSHSPVVLIVDDNEINRIMIGRMLQKLGCRYEYAEDGLAGVRMCATRSYDLILMDLNMPTLDGIDATELISQVCLPQGYIVCITAYNSEEVRAEVYSVGMTELILKPIRLATLADFFKRTILSEETELRPTNYYDRSVVKTSEEAVRDVVDALGLDVINQFTVRIDQSLRAELAHVKQCLIATDHDDAAKILHGAAGSAAMIGAHRLSTLLFFLEDLAKSERLKPNEPLLARCEDLLKDFKKLLTELKG